MSESITNPRWSMGPMKVDMMSPIWEPWEASQDWYWDLMASSCRPFFYFLKKMDEKSNKNLRFNKVVDPACQKKIPRNSRRPEEPKKMLRVTIFLP
jgi:hypothetical protein